MQPEKIRCKSAFRKHFLRIRNFITALAPKYLHFTILVLSLDRPVTPPVGSALQGCRQTFARRIDVWEGTGLHHQPRRYSMILQHLPPFELKAEDCADAAFQSCDKVRPFAADCRLLPVILSRTDKAVADAYEAIGYLRDNPVTKLVTSSDEKRDEVYERFANYVHGQQSSIDPAIAQAADVLARIVRKHGVNIRRDAYAMESSKLNALFVDLEEAEAAASLEKRGATGLVTELKTAQHEFFEAHKQLIESKADRKVPTITAVAYPLRKSLLQLVDYLELSTDLEPERWANVIGDLNEIVLPRPINKALY